MSGFVRLFLLLIICTVTLSANTVHSAPHGGVDTVSVQAESDLDVALAHLSSDFTRNSQEEGKFISVSNNFGNSALQKKKIEDGESADLFITSQADLVQELKTKGMIDIYSVTTIASREGKNYTAAVVAGENMTSARVFLDFLKSEAGVATFKKNGFSVP